MVVAPRLHHETVCEVPLAVREAPLVLVGCVRHVHFVQAEPSSTILQGNPRVFLVQVYQP